MNIETSRHRVYIATTNNGWGKKHLWISGWMQHCGAKSGLGQDELDWDGIRVGPNLLDWEPPGGANKWIGLGWMGLDGFWVGC